MNVKRERKELSVGSTRHEAIDGLSQKHLTMFVDSKLDVEHDETTGLWSVYHKRRKSDRTIKRAISRVTREPYKNGYGKDRRPIVVTLLPRELIETRLHGTRRRYAISWHDLHAYLVRRHALQVMAAKQKERAERRKARKGQHKRGD